MGVMIVDSRNRPEIVSELGMRCDKYEIPSRIDGPDDPYRWIGICYFVVTAQNVLESEGRDIVAQCEEELVAITISDGIIYGICAPKLPSSPALWFTAPVAQLSVTTAGTLGVFHKRPFKIIAAMEREGWTLVVMAMERLSQQTRRSERRQEQQFLDAISRSG